MYCPSCGKNIAPGSAFCMHCGKPTGLSMQENKAPAPLVPASAGNALKCPSCGQIDEARRALGMVAQGISLSQSSTASSGMGVGLSGATGTRGGVIGAHGQAWSSVSHSKGVDITVLGVALGRIALDDWGIGMYNMSLMPPIPATQGIPGRRVFVAHKTYIRWRAELVFRNTLVLSRFNKSRLDRLYYCARCAVVYVPGEGQFASLSNVESLLYSYPPSEEEFCEVEGSALNLFAMSYGPKGVQCIKEVEWGEFTNINNHPTELDHLGRYLALPRSDSKKTMSNYEQLVAYLKAQGWVQQAEHGPNWWQARFVR